MELFCYFSWKGCGGWDRGGGTVKRSVWRQIRNGQTHIATAEQYTKVAGDRNPNVHVQFIATSKVDDVKLFLDARWEGVRAVPQTHKMHCFIPKGREKLMVADTSDAKEFKMVTIRKSDSEDKSDDSEE